MTKRETLEKVWLSKRSPAYQALERVVTDKSVLSDLRYFTSINCTSNLKVNHLLYDKYCPKHLFSYKGMVVILHLAFKDFNSGVNRKQATTKTGDLQYKKSYLKVTQNRVVKKIPEKKHCKYFPSIMQELALQKILEENCSQSTVSVDIPVNIAPVEEPDKKTEATKQM